MFSRDFQETEYDDCVPELITLPGLGAPRYAIRELRGSLRFLVAAPAGLGLLDFQELADSRWMGIEYSPEPEPPFEKAREWIREYDLARERLVAFVADAEALPDRAPFLEEVRSRIALVPSLSDLGLSEEEIRTLVPDDRHQEVFKRFANARQHLGLNAIEPAFRVYQDAIGGLCSEVRPGWDLLKKRHLVSCLNAAARTLCAYLCDGENWGLLHLGGQSATFQLRRQQRGAPKATLGQSLPLFTLTPVLPDEIGVSR